MNVHNLHCVVCHAFLPKRKCDGLLSNGNRCGRRLCLDCTVPDGQEDFCPLHVHQLAEQTEEETLSPLHVALWELYKRTQGAA